MWAYYFINVTMFVNGAVGTSRKSIGFCFITELAPKLYQPTLGTMWNTSENGLTNIYITTYFWFISKNWMATAYMGLILCFTSFTLVWAFIPESPKWLYSKERYSDLRAVLIYMARLNGVELNT